MHPILVQLIPEYAAILGAFVAILWAASHWASLDKARKTTGRLVALCGLGAVAGAAAGWFIVKHFFVDAGAPAPKIHTFGPLVALGSFLSILYIRREGARRNFDPEVLTGLAVEVLLVGVVGSRILFILITPESFRHDPKASAFQNYFLQYIALWNGGLVWYGGLLPAAIFTLWRAKVLGLPWRTVADIFAPSVMLGLGVGRIGCLMAGDDHGKLVPSGQHWWTLTFPINDETLVSPKELQGKPLYPTQPAMSIGDFIIVLICHSMQRRWQNRPTAVTLLMLTLYPILRFWIETMRGDSVRKFVYATEFREQYDPVKRTIENVPVAGISTSQAISIPLLLLMLVLLVRVLKRPPAGAEKPGPQAALRPEPTEPPPAAPPQPAAPAEPAAPSPAGPPS